MVGVDPINQLEVIALQRGCALNPKSHDKVLETITGTSWQVIKFVSRRAAQVDMSSLCSCVNQAPDKSGELSCMMHGYGIDAVQHAKPQFNIRWFTSLSDVREVGRNDS